MSPPAWLRILAAVSLILSGVSAIVIAADLLRGRGQKMWIMNVVWPITGLWAGPAALAAYFLVGRAPAPGERARSGEKPFWQSVGLGATHCGAGCSLADLLVEWAVLAVPVTLFGREVFGTWAVDFVFAFLFGIAFQYFTIKPQRGLSPGEGLRAAVKADALSLTSWQVGMYGWMAVALFVLFSPEALAKTGPVFWFMMQIAMGFGFLTAYPVNWFLIRRGIKERM